MGNAVGEPKGGQNARSRHESLESGGVRDCESTIYIETRDGVYVDLHGRQHLGEDVGIPTLDLREAKPGPDGRSCIALVARVDERQQLIDSRIDPAALRIEHRSEFGRKQKREAEEEGRPFHELALLYWQNDQPVRVGQVVQHNLALAWGPKGDEENGAVRYFFYAAG